jgi:hypothetical protein
VLGIDRVTNDVVRRRKFLAKKEQADEDAVRVVELEKKLAVHLAKDGQPDLMVRLIENQLWRIKTRQSVYDAVDPRPGWNEHRVRVNLASAQKRSDERALAREKEERRRRLMKWVARVDEVMELRKRLKRDPKQK